jgi:hypothetical protein
MRLFYLFVPLLVLLSEPANALLTSSYDWQVRNTYWGISGQQTNQQNFLAEGSRQSSTGQRISFGTSVLDFDTFPPPGGATGSGPTPDITVQAQATGRDFRVQTSIEHIRSCTPPDCNGVSIIDAVWSASWNATAQAQGLDRLVIGGDSSLDGVAGSFFLPIELTGQIILDQDYALSMVTQPTLLVRSFDLSGNQTSSFDRTYPNTWSRLNPPVDVTINESTGLVVPFIYNQAFDLITNFRSQVSVGASSFGNWTDLTRMEASSDFSNTLHFNPFTDFMVDTDGDGEPDSPIDLANLQIISSEGIDYLTDVPSIPLPPAVWLFGSGLLGLIGIARRKKAT